jgi:hypothetical protein
MKLSKVKRENLERQVEEARLAAQKIEPEYRAYYMLGRLEVILGVKLDA